MITGINKNSMNRKTIIPLGTFLILTASLGAQVKFSGHHYYNTFSTSTIEPRLVEVIDGVSTIHYSLSKADFNGSPYLSEEFVEGTMTVSDGTVIPGLKYRYDIYGDKMQFILNRDTAVINRPMAVRSLVMGDRKFVYEVYMVQANRVATGYFEMIRENENLTILYRRKIEIEQDIYVPNYGGGGGTKEFEMKQDNSYYVKHGNSAAQKIHSRKGLLKIIPDYRDRVKQYMKDHRLSVKKEKDLAAIADYYNSLHTDGS